MKRPAPLRSYTRLRSRTPLRSSKPLSRGEPMRRTPMKRKTTRRRERDRPFDRFTRWLHGEAICDATIAFPGHVCEGPLQQMHVRNIPGDGYGVTGMGRKELPTMTILACRIIHDEFDGRDRKGQSRFSGMTPEEKTAWLLGRIAVTQARYHANVSVLG
jgi:hypothetical protein